MKVTKSFTVETRGIGHPDYAAPKPVGQVPIGPTYTLTDVGELAARLGSIVTFDRRGNVIWLDDFEGDIDKWYQEPHGTDAAIVASADRARNGSFSVKLTTGNAIDDYALIAHYSPYPVTSKVGFEISFTIHNLLSELAFSHRLYDGNYEHYARLRYLPATDVLQYLDSEDRWQDLVTDLVLYAAEHIFNTIKVVIDLTTYKYVRAILNGVEYDMSALSYRHIENTVMMPRWMQLAHIMTGIAFNRSAYMDDAIVTQNEP